MYSVKYAVVLGKTLGSTWTTQDVSTGFLYDLFLENKQVYLVVEHPSTQKELYVDMEPLRTTYYQFNGTVQQWLFSIENMALPFVDKLPDLNRKYVAYENACQVGYDINLGHVDLNYEYTMPKSFMTDLKITRERFPTDLRNLSKRALVTVNGFIHNVVSDEQKAIVINGAVSSRIAKETNVGIISFMEVGELTKIPLKDGNISPFETNGSLSEKIRITLDEDPGNKMAFMVLGGYIVMPEEGVFFRTGDRTWSLDINKLHYVERILESKRSIDIGSLGLTKPSHAPKSVSLEELYSDEVIKNYLKLSQSFMVVVDSDNLFTKFKYVQRASFPGQFLMGEEPKDVLIGPYGKILETWKIREGNRWSLSCIDTFHRDYVYTERERGRSGYASEALDCTRRYDHAQAQFIEISSVKG